MIPPLQRSMQKDQDMSRNIKRTPVYMQYLLVLYVNVLYVQPTQTPSPTPPPAKKDNTKKKTITPNQPIRPSNPLIPSIHPDSKTTEVIIPSHAPLPSHLLPIFTPLPSPCHTHPVSQACVVLLYISFSRPRTGKRENKRAQNPFHSQQNKGKQNKTVAVAVLLPWHFNGTRKSRRQGKPSLNPSIPPIIYASQRVMMMIMHAYAENDR